MKGNVMGGQRRGKVYKVTVGKPEGKRPLRRQRSRCEGKIRMDLMEIEWRGANSVGSG
jgi:hypothetical protein